jgi:hypothetical protein
MGIWKDQVLVWGGYNGDWLSDLWVLDVLDKRWIEVEIGHRGRITAAAALYDDSLYIFGAAKTDPLLRFHWPTRGLETVKVSGTQPPADLVQATMVCIGNFLILLGGKGGSSGYCSMFGFHVGEQRWFIFPVIPDGQSTTLRDGIIDREGQFLQPRIWSCSAVYRTKERDLILFLGGPILDPPALGIVKFGEALAGLQIQRDLAEQLKSDNNL